MSQEAKHYPEVDNEKTKVFTQTRFNVTLSDPDLVSLAFSRVVFLCGWTLLFFALSTSVTM